jgi:hypothetical protein
LLGVKLTWSDFIKVSQLRLDLKMPEISRGYWKFFDQKYPDLRGWGLYMYIHQRQKIVYVGETGREGERPFRGRIKEELLPDSKFCREIERFGIDINSLELKVAIIESVVISSNFVKEIDTKRIEKLLICAVAPLYDPHKPEHAKESFQIRNFGEFSPLLKLYAMKRGDECKCLHISRI